ncbi:MAG: hypothetical protein EPN48_15950 [Microbacteriaceae bacterium]|nr:MAG: hypothetical protein EPN48_15950 [Microbacteriaceae bacterium]
MKKNRWLVGVTIAAAVTLGISGCASGGGSSSGGSTGKKDLGSATILGNWFAQAEMGGYIAADANDLGKKYGVKVNFKQGGPGIQTIPQVAAGKAEFGVGNADEILVARQSGLPIVAVAAGPAENLQCLAYHKSTGITDFASLNKPDVTVSRVPSPYWDFIQGHFHLNDVKVVNITSLAAFQKDQNMVLQCFITNEPYTIQKMGLSDIGYLRVKDSGYNAYQDMLFTTESFAKQHPDVVKAVVAATVDGWNKLLTDPSATAAFVKKQNPDADPGVFDFAVNLMKKDNILGTPDIGQISDARMKELRDQLAEIKQVKPDMDYKSAFTTEFLPSGK